MISEIIIFSFGLFFAKCEEEAMLSAVTVNEKYLAKLDDDLPHFVFFYTTWSKYCVRVAPAWEDLADKYNNLVEKPVVIGKTDCLLDKKFCDSENVTGFPGIKFYANGLGIDRDEGIKYKGDRDVDSLEIYLRESLGMEIEDKKEEEFEEKFQIEDGVYMLSNTSFSQVINDDSDTFVAFCPIWSVPCQRLSRPWSDLGNSLAREDDEVRIAEVDCNLYPDVCQQEAITNYPTLIYYRRGQRLEVYKEPRTFGELREFVKRLRHSLGEEDDEETVAVLDRDNFEDRTGEVIFTFILFHADWCRHCRGVADTWEEVALKYKENSEVMIGSVDCNAADNVNKELCQRFGVRGVPNIKILKNGDQAGSHSGGRDLEDLTEMVERYIHPENFPEEEEVDSESETEM